MTRKRLFIAIPLPSEARTALAGFQQRWRHAPVRWVRSEDLHITVVFLGSMEAAAVSVIEEAMRAAATAAAAPCGARQVVEPFGVALTRIVVKPSLTRPRLVWVAGDGGEQIQRVFSVLSRRLIDAGLYRDSGRPFRTHVTLGRVKMGAVSDALAPVHAELDVRFVVRALQLKESDLRPDGAVHRTISVVPLGVEQSSAE